MPASRSLGAESQKQTRAYHYINSMLTMPTCTVSVRTLEKTLHSNAGTKIANKAHAPTLRRYGSIGRVMRNVVENKNE